ncbi:MAG: hypothetical protein LAT76_10135 [Schleiferiaceae bacterium]|nr:hypothetical protein [Schleiferiaceae bacterium]
MGPESFVDFNNLAEHPEMQAALKDWEERLSMTYLNTPKKLDDNTPFVYKNFASEFILKMHFEEGQQLGNAP